MLTLWRHYMTLNSLSRGHIGKKGPGVITISLNEHGSERFEQIWRVYNVFEFSPLTYLRTWPEVNHIRIRDIQDVGTRWYTKSCDLQIFLSTTVAVTRLQTFFGDWVTWPCLMTWAGVTWSQIFHKMCENNVKIAFVLRYREKPRKRGKVKHPE